MTKILLFFFILSALTLNCIGSRNTETPVSPDARRPPLLDKPLPFDPDVLRDTLENGLVYYIRKNTRPEQRAELRLVVNAGSILEDEDQLGLAHFCEHMAFNGTKNFAKNDLINYLESVGMRFGPEINAYTSFDETVYMLEIPTDSLAVLETGLQILRDWAGDITFDSLEIEKERGVVIEEWRSGRGAEARIRDRQLPVLLQGSRYAHRLPIGNKETLDSFRQETLKRFYREWYRPDLMSVIAVGDFAVNQVQQLIIQYFSDLTVPGKGQSRELFPVPDHDETLYAITSDREARSSSVAIYHKLPVQTEHTLRDYREQLMEMLYHQMFNQRLSETARKADPPFLMAGSGKGRFVRSSEVYMLNAMVKDNGIPAGLEGLLREARRVKEFGFTETELERNKTASLRRMKQVFEERDRIPSAQFAAEYIRNFLVDEPVPGIAFEFQLYQQLIPGISLQSVNALAGKWITELNRVIMVSYPEKEGMDPVDENLLREVLTREAHESLDRYVDNVLILPLLEKIPGTGAILREDDIPELSLTELVLGNGVRVILKPTDFQNDEILFTAFSPGGYSLVPDSGIVAAKTAVSAVREGGLGNFDREQLQKILSDKVVSVSPYIDELSEGLSGSASPADLESLFQLIYLWFTGSREDSLAFHLLRERFRGFYQNRSASPEAAFQDTLTVTLTRHHPRYRPWTVHDLEGMNLKESGRIFKDRFADASDFTFIFVGNFTVENLKPWIARYLGNLPAISRQETWQDVTYEYPAGVVDKRIYKGLEDKSQTAVVFSGNFQWTLENQFTGEALLEVLRIRLRERIREQLGGTYGVRVGGSFSRYPRERYQITLSFGSDPDRSEELEQAVFAQIDSLKEQGMEDGDLAKVKEMLLREYETDLRENDFWLDVLENRYSLKLDPRAILRIPDMIRNLTVRDIQGAARKYLKSDNYIRVVLYPEARRD